MAFSIYSRNITTTPPFFYIEHPAILRLHSTSAVNFGTPPPAVVGARVTLLNTQFIDGRFSI